MEKEKHRGNERARQRRQAQYQVLKAEFEPSKDCDCYDDGVGPVLGPSCEKHRPHSKEKAE